MNLTKEKIAEFVGGDVEIQYRSEGYIYRGPIKSAIIENDILLVKFVWLAKGKAHPPLPINQKKKDKFASAGYKWKREDKFASDGFVRNLRFYDISEIDNGRLAIWSPIRDELLILFPANDSNLDPAKVKGLKCPVKIPA